MEELKLLIELVKDLPSMALWVLAGFFAYKVIMIGSWFSIIRLIINKGYDLIKNYNNKNKIAFEFIDDIAEAEFYSVINQYLKEEVDGAYIHPSDVTIMKGKLKKR